MNKKRIVDGRMVVNTGTRVTIRAVTDADKYAYILKLMAYTSGASTSMIDARLQEVMAKMPLEDVK